MCLLKKIEESDNENDYSNRIIHNDDTMTAIDTMTIPMTLL